MLTIEPVVTKQRAGVVVAALRGSADIHCVDALQAGLNALAVEGTRAVVLDLSSCDILTSLAIGVLVSFRKRVMEQGSVVVLAAVPEPIAKSLRFTRVSELFARAETVEGAVSVLGG